MTTSWWVDSLQVGNSQTDGLALGYTLATTISGGGGFSATGGPFNDRFMNGSNGNRLLGINAASLACGFWIKVGTQQAATLWQGLDGASAQFTVRQTATGAIEVRTGGTAGTVLGTSAVVLVTGAWQFVEIEINVNSSGSYTVWVDGTSVLTGSGSTRGGTANNYVTNILNGGNSNTLGYNSIYVRGDTAASSATRHGPVKPYVLVATGDGAFTAWTANTGTRWQAIDEVPTHDTDNTYISDNNAGDKNSIAITDTVAGIGTIFGLAHYYWARRDDAGPHTMRSFLRDSGGTEQVEPTQTLAASYVGYPEFREFSPFTGGSTGWTSTEIDGLQLCVELVT